MRFIKIFLCLMVCAVCMVPVQAESAKGVLDQTAAKLKSSGGISADFVATTFKNKEPLGGVAGSICIQGNKFKITSPQTTTWFDGVRQWSLMSDSKEAYISEPTEEELQSINPYNFVNLYKSGYSMKLKNATYKERDCHEVILTAKNKSADIPAMILTIDKATSLPLCVRFKQSSGNWVRIQISGISTNKNWDASFFEFNKSEFPQVEIIDIR